MDVVFVGHAVPERLAGELSGISIAGNKMQLNIIKYLAPNVEHFFSTTVYPISSYKNDGHIVYKREEIELFESVTTIRVPFINLFYIKQVCQIIANYWELKKIVKKYPNTILFTFNMYPQIGLPSVLIKKKYGNKIVCLLADLPIDDDYGRKGISKIIHRRFNKMTERYIRQVDKAIVLNKLAWELYAPQAEYIVIDGGIDIDHKDA